MSLRLIPFLMFLTAILAACMTSEYKAMPAPPPSDVTPGSTFTVVKGFLIPSGDNNVYFQDEHLYPLGEIQTSYPYCQFVTGAATDAGELIHEGVLTVSKVDYDEDSVGSGGVDVSVTAIHLKDASSEKSYRMNCMLPRLFRGAGFVTPAEIEGAVGGYLDLDEAP